MTNKNYKEQMIPYVPTWEAHNTSADNLVGKFTKAYCNVPRGKVQGQKYCIAVQSLLALANNQKKKYWKVSSRITSPSVKATEALEKPPAAKP